MRSIALSVDNGDAMATVRNFLKQLMTNEMVIGVLVPMILPGDDGFVQGLIRNPAMLDKAYPAAPTMAVQSAKILSDLTFGPAVGGRIAVVLKSCEMRAVVELFKFLQVKLDNIITIGIDCPGTCEVRDYAEMAGSGDEIPEPIYWEGMKEGSVKPPAAYPLRQACRICEYPVPLNTDITIGFFGYDPKAEILLMVNDGLEEELTGKIPMNFSDGVPDKRSKAIELYTARLQRNRDKVMDEQKGRIGSIDGLMQVLSTCIRCHNCMNACPICYCRECVFNSSIFDHTTGQYLNQAARKGAIRMPADTLMFHLTRLSHMATSCIGCGMCESACPNQLPVSSLFTLMGSDLQGMFNYVPGRSIDEEPPVSVFRENELQTETGSMD